MRDLEKSAVNELTIDDTISGSDIRLYYRTPTTQEVVAYQKDLWERKGKKISINAEMRIAKGLKILTGFRDGDFGYKKKPISSDPASANYREDWKDLLKETASDILCALSVAVFEGAGRGQEEYADEPDEEKALPLATSSGD